MKRESAAIVLLSVGALLGLTAAAEGQTSRGEPLAAAAGDGEVERAAMRGLDFLIGEWQGDGWIQIAPDQRLTFVVSESYRYRGGGLVIDGEGTFRPPPPARDSESFTRYSLGVIFFDRDSDQYRMWHWGGSTVGHTFTVTVDVDPRERALGYTTVGGDGQPYRFGLRLGEDGVWTATTERPGPEGTWRTTMAFQMRRADGQPSSATPPGPTDDPARRRDR